MKLYEYVAAGIPVVAPREIANRAPMANALAGFDSTDPNGLGETLEASIDLLRVSDEDRELARSRDWSAIAAGLLAFATEVRGPSALVGGAGI